MKRLFLTLALLLSPLVQAQDELTHSAPLPEPVEISQAVSAPESREAPAPAPEAPEVPAPDPVAPPPDPTPPPPVPILEATPEASPAPVPTTVLVPVPIPNPVRQLAPTSTRAAQQALGDSIAASLLPRPPKPNLLRAILLLLATLVCVGVANLAERPLEHLASTGLLPSVLKALVVLCRGSALLVAFLGVLHLVPSAWSPAVAYVLVGTAFAVGWSVREVVQDVLVGLIFILERSFRAGQRLRFEGITGTLTRMTFRVTWLRTDEGADIAIPNRKLTNATLELDSEPYAPVSVLLLVPPCRSSVEARTAIRELALLNPYLAPGEDPQVYRQADDPQRWRVKARLLDARYADRFRGTMVDLVEEVFGPPQGPCGCDEES